MYGDRLTPGWGVVGDVISIRRHLWEEDVPHLGEVRHWSNDVLGGAVGAEGLPPPLEVGARFDIVIAADVLYFFEQVVGTTTFGSSCRPSHTRSALRRRQLSPCEQRATREQ